MTTQPSKPAHADATPRPWLGAKWENDNGLVAMRYQDGSASFDIFDSAHWHGPIEEAKWVAERITAATNSHDAAVALAELVGYMRDGEKLSVIHVQRLKDLARAFETARKGEA